ncbi:MAG: plasmid stabilization system protein ParE [Verrucomicrobiales bacterium]|jgi:plasmid stabilization system protein ParE
MTVELIPAARFDVDDQAEFWESKSKGLGLEFIEHIEDEVFRIQQDLERGIFGRKVGEFWKTLTERFSTAIYYRVTGEMVVIFAIFNTREDPAWIAQQLRIR